MAHLKEFRGIEGTNFFEQDRGLKILLGDLLPAEEQAAVFASLHECAGLVAGGWNDLAREAGQPEHLPKIIKFDRVGNPVERIEFSPLTRRLRREVAEFGVLTNTRSELHKFGLLYLLGHLGEASLTCPISCTDGLIRSIEAKGSAMLQETYLPLVRSAETPFGGAQFVTERTGGSDVGAIETQATPNDDGTWTLTGEKWFCSNPDEFFAVAAKPAGVASGTAGVALFFVPRVLLDGQVNHISFRRLKDKLGTRSLPTAELAFEGATAYPIGEPGEGFKTLMNYVINASRMHNATNACGAMHRAFLEARNYARQRETFGHSLISYPLVQETLVALLERLWRNRQLTFRLIALVDQHGIAPDSKEQAMWQRFLVNLAKYRTARLLTDSIREAILLLGGNGIVEDFTILPRLLRDAMIIETWEGPHNTLCLQIIRDMTRSTLFEQWRSEVAGVLERWPQDFLSHTRRRFEQVLRQTEGLMTQGKTRGHGWAEMHARRFVDRLGDLLELAWMAETALKHADEDATAALLTAAAGRSVFVDENPFEHPDFEVLTLHAAALIDEAPIKADAL